MRKILSAGAASAFLAIVCDFFVVVAQAAPVPNLPLTCPNAAAIGQTNCSGLVYQLPNNDQLIVSKGPASAPTWARAASLASSETLGVCSLPVEPGTYSSCKDSSGARRIVYIPKSQVFTSSTPSPPPSSGAGARVLDLSRAVVISEPGVYVLNRDWRVEGVTGPARALAIRADNVTLDLQGFELSADGVLIDVDGSFVTVRNGRLRTSSAAIVGGGRDVLIDAMRMTSGSGVDLYGAGTVLANSFISAQHQAVFAERGVTVRNNVITSEDGAPAVLAQYGAYILDNQLTCEGDVCVELRGRSNVVSNNILTSTGTAIKIAAGNSQILDNDVILRTSMFERGGGGEPLFTPRAGEVAIDVQAGKNTIRGNFVEPTAPFPLHDSFGAPLFVPWQVGIRFTSSDNRYGDNLMGAQVPFDLGATVQTDLGGNVGLVP